MTPQDIITLQTAFSQIEALKGKRIPLRELENAVNAFCEKAKETGYVSDDDGWADERWFFTDCFPDYEPSDVIFGAPCSKGILNPNDRDENFFEIQFIEDIPGDRYPENLVEITFTEIRL